MLIKLEEELKYVSVEPNHAEDNASTGPRDSVEPRSTGRFRATDELHHGPMRLTDEIMYIKGERRTDELNLGDFRADSTDSQRTPHPSYFCAHPLCLDFRWQPAKFFTRKGDLTRHTEAYHGSLARPLCPVEGCNIAAEAEELRQHFIANHLDDEAGKRISVRVKPVRGHYINYETKGFAFLQAPAEGEEYRCELGCPTDERDDSLFTDHLRERHYRLFHFIALKILRNP